MVVPMMVSVMAVITMMVAIIVVIAVVVMGVSVTAGTTAVVMTTIAVSVVAAAPGIIVAVFRIAGARVVAASPRVAPARRALVMSEDLRRSDQEDGNRNRKNDGDDGGAQDRVTKDSICGFAQRCSYPLKISNPPLTQLQVEANASTMFNHGF